MQRKFIKRPDTFRFADHLIDKKIVELDKLILSNSTLSESKEEGLSGNYMFVIKHPGKVTCKLFKGS